MIENILLALLLFFGIPFLWVAVCLFTVGVAWIFSRIFDSLLGTDK